MTSGVTVREQLERRLSRVGYQRCFHLLCEMHYRLVTPHSFRQQMKFLFRHRHHSHLLSMLNPLLPDEYQFTHQELQQQDAEASDYPDLKKFWAPIRLVNDLTKVVHSSQELGNFYELVKSRKRKQIDNVEFYESAYKRLRGKFHLMHKLGNMLGDPVSPSYIKQPMTSGEDQVLNKSCRIYTASTNIETDKDPYYIYRVDRVIEQSRGRPRMNGMTSEERQHNGAMWRESTRCELDVVLGMLKVAEEEVQRALGKIKVGKWPVNAGLKEHLEENGVKVKMLEMMFGELEILLMRAPLESLPGAVDKLRQKEEVSKAIRELYKMRI